MKACHVTENTDYLREGKKVTVLVLGINKRYRESVITTANGSYTFKGSYTECLLSNGKVVETASLSEIPTTDALCLKDHRNNEYKSELRRLGIKEFAEIVGLVVRFKNNLREPVRIVKWSPEKSIYTIKSKRGKFKASPFLLTRPY